MQGIKAALPGHMERIYHEHGNSKQNKEHACNPARFKSMEVSLPEYSYHETLDLQVSLLEGNPKVKEVNYEQAEWVVDHLLKLHFRFAYNNSWRCKKMRADILGKLEGWDNKARFYVFNEIFCQLPEVRSGEVPVFVGQVVRKWGKVR